MDFFFIWFLLIGILAGYITGRLTKGSGYGVVGDLIIGVLGSFLGGFIFRVIGVEAYSLLGQLIMAVIGALILLKLVSYLRHKGV